MVYRVGMYNYYAYDDGIPELGYGVSNAGGMFAVRFDISDYDTIQGVQLLFNHTLNDANDKYFDIMVWKDENGKPGDTIFTMRPTPAMARTALQVHLLQVQQTRDHGKLVLYRHPAK